MDKVCGGTVRRKHVGRRLNKLDGGKERVENICVLVCSGCHKKIPQIRWLKQMNFIFSVGGWKSQIEVPAGFCFFGGLSP